MKRFFWVGLVMMGLVGCGGSPAPAPSSSGSEAAPTKTETAKKGLEIAVIPKGLAHQFWVAVKSGAEAAARENGATILWQGPSKETEIDKQISIVQDMIVRKVDALVLAACDENALVGAVAQADQAGIPVVMIDSAVKSDIPKTLVATDNIAAAKEAAKTLCELMGGSGDVGLIPFVAGAATSEMREQGFKEGIAAYPNVKLVATQYSQSDVGLAMNVTTDMLTGFPTIAGIFGSNEPSAIGAAQALRASGKAGTVKLVGFDASGEEINALKEGVIQAILVQNPFKMGYEGVKAAIAAKKGEPVEKRIDTGVTVITKDNLETPEIQALLKTQS